MRITNPSEVATFRAAAEAWHKTANELENAVREYEQNEKEAPGYNQWSELKRRRNRPAEFSPKEERDNPLPPHVAEASDVITKLSEIDPDKITEADFAKAAGQLSAILERLDTARGYGGSYTDGPFKVHTHGDEGTHHVEVEPVDPNNLPTEDEFVVMMLKSMPNFQEGWSGVLREVIGDKVVHTYEVANKEEAVMTARHIYRNIVAAKFKRDQRQAKRQEAAEMDAQAQNVAVAGHEEPPDFGALTLAEHDPNWVAQTSELIGLLSLVEDVQVNYVVQESFTICVLRVGKRVAVGASKCSVKDIFNAEIGERLALRRAYERFVADVQANV